MDVVKRKISEINGEIEVDSVLNAGTKVTIKLPPSLSIMDGLLVQISDTRFIIPLSSVDQIYGISYAQIKNSYNNLIILSGENIPYFNLRDEYGYDSDFNEKTTLQVVVVKYNDKRIALVIDKVIGEHQAVLKPLGKMFRVQESISGASILGDGSIALVIDTNKFIETYSRQEALTI